MILTKAASIAFYVLFFIMLGLFSYLGFYKKNKVFAVFAILLPVLVAGFRFNVGTDYAAYSRMFDEIMNETPNVIWARFITGGSEPFILLLAVICRNLLFGRWLFFAIFSFITVFFLYKAFNKFDEKRSWLLYTASLLILFPLSLNAMRQTAAVAVVTYVLISLVFDKDKKYLKNSLLTLFAIFLHYSTLLFLPVLIVPILAMKLNYKRLSLYIVCALGSALMILPILMPIIVELELVPEKYTSTFMVYDSATISFDLMIIVIISALYYITRKHLNGYSRKTNRVMLTMMACGIFYSGLGLFSAYIGRMADFFWPLNIIALWVIVDRFKDSETTKYILFLLVPVLYFVASCIIMGNNQIIPYQILL